MIDPLGLVPKAGRPPLCDQMSGTPKFKCSSIKYLFTWRSAEEAVFRSCEKLSPGKCRKQLPSSDRKRIVDVIDTRRGILYEVKTGVQSRTGNLVSQISRDSDNLKRQIFTSTSGSFPVYKIAWMFFPNFSGISWPSQPLVRSLLDHSFHVYVYYTSDHHDANHPWVVIYDSVVVKQITTAEESLSAAEVNGMIEAIEAYLAAEAAELLGI